MNFQKMRADATKLADAIDADIFFYNGDISAQYESEFVKLGNGSPRRTNVVLREIYLGGRVTKVGAVYDSRHEHSGSEFLISIVKSHMKLIAVAIGGSRAC